MNARDWTLAEIERRVGLCGDAEPGPWRSLALYQWMRGEVGRHSNGTKPRVYAHGDMPWCWECDQAGPCAWLDRLASALGYSGEGAP